MNVAIVPLGKYLIWFALSYLILLAVVAGLSLAWTDITNHATLPALMAAAMGTSSKFVSDHKRAFDDAERRHMTRLSFLIAWVLSLASTLFLVAFQVGWDQLGELFFQLRMVMETPPNGAIAAGSVVFVSLLLYVLLNFCYGRMARNFAKALAKT